MSRSYEARVKAFWRRLYERQAESGNRIRIREFDRAYQSIVKAPANLTAEVAMRTNSQVAPFGIVSVDWQGNVTSFSA